MKKVYTSIDIGSDTVKFITAEHYQGKNHVLAATTIKSKGIRKGLIIDSNVFAERTNFLFPLSNKYSIVSGFLSITL